MGKPKKGKKAHQDEDFENDNVEIEKTEDTEMANQPVSGAKRGKKGRRNKKEDDWEDDVAAELDALSIDAKGGEKVTNGDTEDEPIQQPKKKEKTRGGKKVKIVASESEEEDKASDKEEDIMRVARSSGRDLGRKGKMAAMSAFQMMGMEDDDENDDDDDNKSEDEVVPAPVQKKGKAKKQTSLEDEEDPDDLEPEEVTPQSVSNKNKKKAKKENKKGKQKGGGEEEDIDALLAQIDGGGEEKKEGKKKKKKGKAEEDVVVPEVPEEEDEGINISNMTQDEIAAMLDAQDDDEDDRKKRKKKKKGGEEQTTEVERDENEVKEVTEEEGGEVEEEGSTVKTAAQKKKEKRERQKLQKMQEKTKGITAVEKETPEAGTSQVEGEASIATPLTEAHEQTEDKEAGSDDEGEDKKKKKKDRKKKKKGEEEKEDDKKKKPAKGKLKAMQEALAQLKEDEERAIREEEEKQLRIEEAMRVKEEKDKLEKEKREQLKLKKKQKLDELKASGKYLTPKQKEAQKRAQQMLEAMRAQGMEVPQTGEAVPGQERPKKKVVYVNKAKQKRQQQASAELKLPTTPTEIASPVATPVEETEVVPEKKQDEEKKIAKEDVKDDWDMSSEEEGEEEVKEKVEKKSNEGKKPAVVKQESKEEEESEESEEEESGSEEESDSEEESSEESSSEEEEKLTPAERAERAKDKARQRMQKRHEVAESKKTADHLRAPVVCVLGHVDTGKTKILDKLRRTNVQEGEAGGITQQIGATNVPEHTIKEQTKMCKDFCKKELKIPGLLIIDTPGHESFSNLRNRGSSLCDIAILVVDIMHGLEPQTIESINLLKQRKTPFVVALNKVDRLFQWQSNPHSDVVNTIKKQKPNTKLEFDERTQQVVVQFAEQGLNVCLYYENKNPREYISLVPTSAVSGDGMGSLIALICDLTQTMLTKKLMWSEELQAITMEVKSIPGLGTTVDVILVNGHLKEGDTCILAGTEGPIVTQIRGLLMPQPLKELRVKSAYEHHKEIQAAQGVKIIAKDLEKSLAGLPMYVSTDHDEIEVYKEDLEEALGDILGSIKLQERGVFVQASTLGSLEALLEFLRTSSIPYAGINIGPVHKKDIMKASIMLEHDSQYAVILAFDVKVEREAQEMSENLGVRIFTADIIYHLFDRFMAYRDELKRKKQEEFKHLAVFPCKLRILPEYVFNSRDPIVCGVLVEAGFVKVGTPITVPSKQFLDIGVITSVENNHKPVELARKGMEVCIKIEPIPGEAPKLFGRHFDETDTLCSKISRQSIDAVKDWFREDMTKPDWHLLVDLKKLFAIL